MNVKDFTNALINPSQDIDPALTEYVNNPVDKKVLTNQPSKDVILEQKLRESAELEKQKEKLATLRVFAWQPILEQIPEFQELSEQGKQNAIKTLKEKPEEFLKVVSQTPYYKQLSEKGRERLKQSLFEPDKYLFGNNKQTVAEKHGQKYEGDAVSPDVYMDPTGWIGGAVLGLKAIPGIVAGDIAGESVKALAYKGENPYKPHEENFFKDWLLPMVADILSGYAGVKIADRLSQKTMNKIATLVEKDKLDTVKKLIKREASDVKDKEIDELTQKMKAVLETPPEQIKTQLEKRLEQEPQIREKVNIDEIIKRLEQLKPKQEDELLKVSKPQRYIPENVSPEELPDVRDFALRKGQDAVSEYLEAVKPKDYTGPYLIKPKEKIKQEIPTQEIQQPIKPVEKTPINKPIEEPTETTLAKIELDQTEIFNREKHIRQFRPYPMMGNKEQLLAQKGYVELFKAGVENSDRVIDAFMGTGVNSNVLPLITKKKVPVIKNEFNQYRYNVYKALKENPEQVLNNVNKHINTIKQIHEKYLPNTTDWVKAKKEIETYLKQNLDKDPATYIVAQHFTPSSKPINELNDVVVDLRKDNKIRGFKSFINGEIDNRLKNIAKVLKEYPHEIKHGDAWELVAKEAKKGDLVIFDPDYIAEEGRKVAGYKATEEDKNLKTFLEKIDKIVLPKARNGVKFIITNTWDEDLAKALKDRGFRVFKTTRRSAKSVKQELLATNFDREGKTVYTVHDTSNAGRGFREIREGLSERRGSGENPINNAPQPERKVEGTGSARLSDEIRDNGRGGLNNSLTENKENQKALEILIQLENASKGERFINRVNEGKGWETKVISKHSSFPDWIPEYLRSKKLIDKVLEHIQNNTVPNPKHTRVKELYDIVKAKIEDKEPKITAEDVEDVELFSGIPTAHLFKALSKADETIYKKLTSKIEDTKFDKFARKYLLADKYGFGSLSRSKEDKVINDYLKLKAHLARGDMSAEKKEKILNKYLDRINEGARKIREKFMIQYLENPTVRGKARQELPELSKELDQIRKEIDRLGKLKMEKGLITPSQFEKWKDKYLTRLYLMDDEIEGLDITRGLKQYEEKKGRKIESIVDFIEYLKKENSEKAKEWEKKAVLDPIKAVKATLAKSYANLAIDDFYRKMINDPEIVPQKYLVELPVEINKLPKKMSPYYAEKKVIPYLRDILSKDRNNNEIRDAIKFLRKQIEEKKALIENDIHLIDKHGYKQISEKSKARFSVISGLPIHKDIANMIEGMTRIIENPMYTASRLDKFATSAIAYFKWAKVPGNIFAYPRNLASNLIQFAMSGADPASFPIYYGKAVKNVLSKDKYYNLAKKWGLFHSNLASEEISKIFQELGETIKPDTPAKQVFKKLLKGLHKTGEAYGWIDDLAKLARFRYALEVEKKPIKEALRIAQDTHFDYSLTYNVIRAMRDPNVDRGVFLKLFGTLFPTYSHKALSFLYDTIVKRPATLTALLAGFYALKQYIEQRNEEKIGKEKYEKLKKLRPEFLDNPFVIPVVEDKGKWIMFVDPSYIVPFGNWVSFGQDLLQGDFGEALREMGALSNPIYSAKGLFENKDPLTGGFIYYTHNEKQKLKDITKYSLEQFVLPLTVMKIDQLTDSKHPVLERILTGMLWYEYPESTLKEFKKSKIDKIKFDTNYWIIPLKKDLRYWDKKYRDGKISKEEYESKKKEIMEEIKKYRKYMIEAIKEEANKMK